MFLVSTAAYDIRLHVRTLLMSWYLTATIELKQHIAVYNICNSGVALQIGTEDKDTKKYESSTEHSASIKIECVLVHMVMVWYLSI